jgi:hypothetical protein
MFAELPPALADGKRRRAGNDFRLPTRGMTDALIKPFRGKETGGLVSTPNALRAACTAWSYGSRLEPTQRACLRSYLDQELILLRRQALGAMFHLLQGFSMAGVLLLRVHRLDLQQPKQKR